MLQVHSGESRPTRNHVSEELHVVLARMCKVRSEASHAA